MKAVLAMKCGVIPRHLHFRNPNPQMDWDRLPVRVTSESMEWPCEPNRPPTAGVSGFGWSGTNAHVVLQGYDTSDGVPRAADERLLDASPPHPIPVSLPESVAALPRVHERLAARETRLLPLSGKTDKALRELAGRYLSWLDDRAQALASGGAADSPLADMAWTAAMGRSHFDYRAGLPFRDAESLRERVRAVAESEAGPEPREAGKVAFAYTGQASQWVGMGETLYRSEPVVRAALDRCDALLRDARDGASLLDVMFGRNGAAGDLDDPMWKQPAIYALECALTALWSSLGVRPSVVLGHSLGEIAAAHTAGAFSLEDGLRFASARGSLIGALPGEGAMAAVFAPASRVTSVLDEHDATTAGPGLSIAADNGAHQVVSGPRAAIEAIVERFEADEVRVRRLRKSPAYHSAMVEPALDDLEAALGEIAFAPPSITLVSNLTGRAVEPDAVLDAAYWRRQAREPVAFRACVETLAELGVDTVVEIGPHAVLGPDDGAGLAGVGARRRTSGGRLEPPATPPRHPRGRDGRRIRRRGRAGVRRQGFRSVSRGCSRERNGVGSRSPATPSSANVTGSRRRSDDARAPATRCSATGTNPHAAILRSRRRCSRPIPPGWATTGCSAGSWCRARSTVPWPHRRPSPRGPNRWLSKISRCRARWSSRRRTAGRVKRA